MPTPTAPTPPATTAGPLIFISHDSRDASLAEAFDKLLTTVSKQAIRCFRSTDKSGKSGIPFGNEWFQEVMTALDAAAEIVCLLTRHSMEKPWVLFEAGVAKGKNHQTPVHALMLGITLPASSPFNQFQACMDDEASLAKLVGQLCKHAGLPAPATKSVNAAIAAFKQAEQKTLDQQKPHSEGSSWRRAIPIIQRLPHAVPARIRTLLETVRGDAGQFFEERGKPVALAQIRANLLLPDYEFIDETQFPGQLYFVETSPHASFSKQELSNRFAPGEGVSGKVFLDGVACAEDGKFGLSAKKLKTMQRLSAVAGFPLRHRVEQYAFGVVCIDFLDAPQIDADDLDDLLRYEPVRQTIHELSRLINPADNPTFELEYAARF